MTSLQNDAKQAHNASMGYEETVKEEEPGFVYFMIAVDEAALETEDGEALAGGTGLIKIGYSTDPTRRAEALSDGTPYSVNLDFYIAGSIADERALHRRFAKHRVRGEWFRACDEITDLIDHLVEASTLLEHVHGDGYEASLSECLAMDDVYAPFLRMCGARG